MLLHPVFNEMGLQPRAQPNCVKSANRVGGFPIHRIEVWIMEFEVFFKDSSIYLHSEGHWQWIKRRDPSFSDE
jgi:hypothetical protein